MAATNFILLLSIAVGSVLAAFLIDRWADVKTQYNSWPDRVKTVIVVVGSAILIKVCMVLLGAVQ